MEPISRFRQNTAACDSLSNINNVKDQYRATSEAQKVDHQTAVKPSRATT
jgi:hypothetical protein